MQQFLSNFQAMFYPQVKKLNAIQIQIGKIISLTGIWTHNLWWGSKVLQTELSWLDLLNKHAIF